MYFDKKYSAGFRRERIRIIENKKLSYLLVYCCPISSVIHENKKI
jgi:hypothetical protein